MSGGLSAFVNKCSQRLDSFDELSAVKRMRSFFMGRVYPAVFCALVLIGHLTGGELYINAVLMAGVSASLLVCETARPMLVPVLTFVFQLSRAHSPGVPLFSDYLFSGWRLALFCGAMSVVAVALVYFLIRRRIFSDFGVRRVRLLVPLILLSLSFLLNGAFSSSWDASGLVWGLLQGVAFSVPYLLFYLGLRTEDKEEIISYFVYATALVALVLVGEVAGLYIFSPDVIVEGEIVKSNILFGWGIWNSAGAALAVLIPTLFLGVVRSRYSFAYFAVATLTLVAAAFTLSRNALLFGGLAYAACAVICCFVGRHRWFYRVLASVGITAVILGAVLLWGRLPELVGGFLSDNGRLALWEVGINNFLSAPIFGVGYFAFEYPADPTYFEAAKFLPSLAHQTFVSLLSGGGAVGLSSYLFYRAATVLPFVKRHSVTKTLLGLSVLTLLLMSLLDNFVFCFFNTFHYSAALAIVEIIRDGEKTDKTIN